MKHIKTFNQLNEGKLRAKIKDNMVHTGDSNLPQFWTTSQDYMKSDNKDLKTGHDPKELVAPEGNDYTWLTDPDDHLNQKDIDGLVDPHVKKFSDFEGNLNNVPNSKNIKYGNQ